MEIDDSTNLSMRYSLERIDRASDMMSRHLLRNFQSMKESSLLAMEIACITCGVWH